MMATTHALVGVLVGVALSPLAPGSGTAIAAAGAAGGLAPDLDALRAHRRTLHLPVLGTAAGALALAVAILTGRPWVLALAAGLLAAGLHAASDVLDGGLSLRPWAERPERAVYCHVQGRWWRPRRLIAYDGSPADLALAGTLAVPTLWLLEAGGLRALVSALLVVSIGYAVARRRLPDYLEAAATRLEPWLGDAVSVRRQ
jgi:hypothetical protein